jgi:cytochrome c peroxidase
LQDAHPSDFSDSAPYFHIGINLTFNDVVNFYVFISQLAHQGKLRNAPVELHGMSISSADVDAPLAFLNALTEDYNDA